MYIIKIHDGFRCPLTHPKADAKKRPFAQSGG